MADFNPQVPTTQDPNYFKYSDSISNVKADVSKGVAIETFGTGLESAVKLSDQTFKDVIKDKVNVAVDKERDQFTGSLEALKGGVIPGPVQTPAGSSVLSFADDAPAQAPAPAAIDAALGKVESVQAALKAGKVNDTYYTQQLNGIAKSLRAQYPGYRDYIDERISQTTGINPANAYVRNLMEDINRGVTNKKTEADKDLDMARKAIGEGIPDADLQFNKLQSDPSYAPTFRTWYNQENAKMYTIKLQDAQRANLKGTKDAIASTRAEDLTREVGMTIDNKFHTQTTLTGTNTPQGILDFVGQVARGEKTATDAQMEQLATLMNTQKNTLAVQLQARTNQLIDGPNGTKVSYVSDIGTEKRDAILKSQLGVYDLVTDALKNKDMGAAYAHMNHARGILDTTKDNILDSDVGSYVAKSKAFLDTMGPNWTNLSITEGLRKNMDAKSRTVFEDNALDARLQPNLAATGVPTTITDHMDLVKKKMTSAQKSVHYDNLISLVDDLRNPNAPDSDKANIARYFYSPEAQNLLRNFKMDYTYTDPTTGKDQVVPGKYAAWTRLTTPDITTQMSKMAKSDPAAGQMYKNWVETTGRELFGEDVRNLNHFTGHDNLTFEWDSKDRQLILKDKEDPSYSRSSRGMYGGEARRLPDNSYIKTVQGTVDRINSGIKNLSQMQDSFGGNTEEYLLNVLQAYGLDYNGKVTGLPKAFGDAIAASRKPQKRMEDTFKDLGK